MRQPPLLWSKSKSHMSGAYHMGTTVGKQQQLGEIILDFMK
jgi:hypothetical protein